jgi:iron-sulfur cluster repair protein YtfE (RIC family)
MNARPAGLTKQTGAAQRTAFHAAGGSTDSLVDLIDQIDPAGHDHLKSALRRAERVADDLADRYGKHAPDAIELAGELKRLRVELEWHMWKEHADFFPLCRRLPSSRLMKRVSGQLTDLLRENRNADELLRRIRQLARGFGTEFGELCSLLHSLEQEAQSYLQTENRILFPQATHLAGPGTSNRKKEARPKSFSYGANRSDHSYAAVR